MIRKAQIKFIATTMAIILIVFSIIFTGLYFVMRRANESDTNTALQELATARYTGTGYYSMRPNGIIASSLGGTNGSIALYYSTDYYTEEEALSIYEQAMAKQTADGIENGNIDAVYYRFVKEGFISFVAIDRSMEIIALYNNYRSAFFILVFLYVLLFLIVWWFSYKIVKPIKDAFEKQKRFISDASHELKTPLTIISANADVLKDEGVDNNWLENIRSQTQRMDSLIADMLTLTRMDEGIITLSDEEFDISAEILSAALPFEAVAFEKGKKLSVSVSPNEKFTGDRHSVKKITAILVDNAIKYATDGSEIQVSLTKKDEKLTLSVYNKGCALDEEQAKKMFERFYRGDNSRNRSTGGSGLGLSIAKGIADANKWKIYTESKLDDFMKISVAF